MLRNLLLAIALGSTLGICGFSAPATAQVWVGPPPGAHPGWHPGWGPRHYRGWGPRHYRGRTVVVSPHRGPTVIVGPRHHPSTRWYGPRRRW